MNEELPTEYKLYKRRWFIMALFMMYTINAGAQILQFSIINHLVSKYYEGITPTQIDWTVTSPMLAYIIFIFPSLYLLDKVGVRNTMIIGAAGITTGTWIKAFSVHPDSFYLALTGHFCQAIFQVMTFSLSARFTAIWFGAHEISTAGALGLFGDQLGSALSCILPTIIVRDGSPEEIGNGLQRLHWYHCGISTVIFLLMVLFFKSAPKSPPSAAQEKQRQSKRENVYRAAKYILKKRSFLLISLSYGLCLGSFGAIVSLLNQTVLMNFPERKQNADAGSIGFVIMLSGMFSSLVFGKIIDKTRKFKESAVLLTIGSTIAFTFFTWALKSGNIIYVYIAAFFIGSFVLSYYATGFQMVIEVTFPVSEEISSAVLFLIVQIPGYTLTSLYGPAIRTFGDLPSNIALIATFSTSALCAILVPSNLKRQQVEKSAQEKIQGREMTDLISNNKNSNEAI
ncbi:uncharacterized MFS-type transporter C09D4.1-like [Planococcus citri]|uniref:uncharacterized MFS-type transporter C09D4.1-like n=1 Tax=Planococcus citri TaxID=170843 RepID=UPI0031F9B8B9